MHAGSFWRENCQADPKSRISCPPALLHIIIPANQTHQSARLVPQKLNKAMDIKPGSMEGQEDPTTLLPHQGSESPEHLEHQQHQEGMHQSMQQQGYIGFGMDPNWGFGQMMHGQAG